MKYNIKQNRKKVKLQTGGLIQKFQGGQTLEDFDSVVNQAKEIDSNKSFSKNGYRYEPIIILNDKNAVFSGKYTKKKILPKKEYQRLRQAEMDSSYANQYTTNVNNIANNSFTQQQFEQAEKDEQDKLQNMSVTNKPTSFKQTTFQGKTYNIPQYQKPKIHISKYYVPEESVFKKVGDWGSSVADKLPGSTTLSHVEKWVKNKWDDWFNPKDKTYQGLTSSQASSMKEKIREEQLQLYKQKLQNTKNTTTEKGLGNTFPKTQSQKLKPLSKPKVEKVATTPISFTYETPSVEINPIVKSLPGMMTLDTDYPTIKLRTTKSGTPISYVNQNNDTIPYQQNGFYPQFTKQFAYPNYKLDK